MSQYVFGVSGSQITLNGQPVKLLGLRCANALISDAETSVLITNLDVFKSYGVNTITVYVMGSRFGDIQGYHPDDSLDPTYAGRLGQIIQAADARGMIVLVGCLYWGTSTANSQLGGWTQTDANRAVSNTVVWLKANNYRNVFVDPDNEGMAEAAKGWSISQMIDAAHSVDRTIMVAYNYTATPPTNADLYIHLSPPVSGKPWLDTEASPNNAPDGGYWNTYSKETNINTGGSYYNYSRIGRYTSAMQTDQENQTISGYQNYNGNCLASSWLQCGAYAVNGPFMTPGGLATNQNVDVNIDVLNPDAGVLWWLEFIQAQYGAWNPPPLRPLITSIAPSNGCASGGTAITIGGFNFRSGSTITMNGVNATSVTWVNSNTLTAVTGANAPGTYNVVVKTPTLSPTTLTNGFTYAGPPAFRGTRQYHSVNRRRDIELVCGVRRDAVYLRGV